MLSHEPLKTRLTVDLSLNFRSQKPEQQFLICVLAPRTLFLLFHFCHVVVVAAAVVACSVATA